LVRMEATIGMACRQRKRNVRKMLARPAGKAYKGGMNTTTDLRRRAVERAVAHYGGSLEAAAAMGVTQGHVMRWIKQGWMPARRALEVEAATKGKIKASSLWGGGA
jgi:hypothetical protein